MYHLHLLSPFCSNVRWQQSRHQILKLQQEKCLIAPNQTKLWAIDKILGPSNLYNIPSVYSVKGEIDLCMFQKSWNIILNRHEILRTVFEEKEDLKTYFYFFLYHIRLIFDTFRGKRHF